NSNLFKCSVNITPISYDENDCLPFKQFRKIHRKDIILRYLAKIEKPIHSLKSTSRGAQRFNDVEVKACGVHNQIDFLNLYQEGVRWFGIHCLYDGELYLKKILAGKNPFLLNYYKKMGSYVI